MLFWRLFELLSNLVSEGSRLETEFSAQGHSFLPSVISTVLCAESRSNVRVSFAQLQHGLAVGEEESVAAAAGQETHLRIKLAGVGLKAERMLPSANAAVRFGEAAGVR